MDFFFFKFIGSSWFTELAAWRQLDFGPLRKRPANDSRRSLTEMLPLSVNRWRAQSDGGGGFGPKHMDMAQIC